MLMMLVQSEIRRLPNCFCAVGRILCKKCGCKGSLLKVREEKYKGEHGGHRWSLLAEKDSFSFSGTFKTYTNV
jgi:hypothetical protein